MKQKKIPADNIIIVPLHGVGFALKPVVYKEEGSFYCLLGPNGQTGILGSGHTTKAAIKDWNYKLAKRLLYAESSDPVVQHVKKVLDELNTSHNEADINISAEAMSDIQLHIANLKKPADAELGKNPSDN